MFGDDLVFELSSGDGLAALDPSLLAVDPLHLLLHVADIQSCVCSSFHGSIPPSILDILKQASCPRTTRAPCEAPTHDAPSGHGTAHPKREQNAVPALDIIHNRRVQAAARDGLTLLARCVCAYGVKYNYSSEDEALTFRSRRSAERPYPPAGITTAIAFVVAPTTHNSETSTSPFFRPRF